MYDRLADDRRNLTLDMAVGIGIGMGGEDAYKAWLASQESTPASGAQRQAGTLGRLAGMFPGAIKARAH